MTRNLGKLDRLIRITIAAFLILLVLSNYLLGTWAIIASILAVILFVTSLIGYCPLYSILGISTRSNR